MARWLWSQLMLVVSDVEASTRFYCDVFGFESGHGGKEYDDKYPDGIPTSLDITLKNGFLPLFATKSRIPV